ncbi:MAG: type IIL restriction-modification enzyme MmeI [Candidatus Nitrotoga sp.]
MSLVALHRGEWRGKRVLDGKEVPVISAYFEDSADAGEPKSLPENSEAVSTGTYFLGDGFMLAHDDAKKLIDLNPRNRDVLFPIINGQEINNDPALQPGRSIINFFDWPIEKAAQYVEPFRLIELRVKPEREKQSDKIGREKWWLFMRARIQAYEKIRSLPRCFASARTTKHLIVSACPTHWLFSDALNFFTTDRWDIYAIVQSTLHEIWARKYSGALETRLRYSPSDCFDNFPFPASLWQIANPALANLGEHYHEHRRALMRQLWLGLTDIYNLFHTRDLTPAQVAKVSKKSVEEAEAGYQGILELRRLHRELDIAIRDAYGWPDLNLGHDFIEVETLPENDRVRYTISPAARKEVLKYLLAENHRRAAAQKIASPVKTKTKSGRKSKNDETHGDLFT